VIRQQQQNKVEQAESKEPASSLEVIKKGSIKA